MATKLPRREEGAWLLSYHAGRRTHVYLAGTQEDRLLVTKLLSWEEDEGLLSYQARGR
jgi:hypothetical protein